MLLSLLQTKHLNHETSALCPTCGRVLEVRPIEIQEDDGEANTLVLFDCPTGDYHGTLTQQQIMEFLQLR